MCALPKGNLRKISHHSSEGMKLKFGDKKPCLAAEGLLAPELRYGTKKANCHTGALSWNMVVGMQQAASHMGNSLESHPSSPKEHGVGQLVNTQTGYQVHHLLYILI